MHSAHLTLRVAVAHHKVARLRSLQSQMRHRGTCFADVAAPGAVSNTAMHPCAGQGADNPVLVMDGATKEDAPR